MFMSSWKKNIQRENELAEIQQEIMGDTLDDAMATEDSEEEEALIVQQVLDELGNAKKFNFK